jgi:hypothetical protein
MVDLLHYNNQYAAPFRALMGRKKRSENLEDTGTDPLRATG